MAYFILPDGSDGDSSIGNYSYGNLIQLDYFKFHQNYWWLRSPNTDITTRAYYVNPDGGVHYSGITVGNSYGRISPDIIGPSYSKNVHRTGIVLGNTNGSVIDSYGVDIAEHT